MPDTSVQWFRDPDAVLTAMRHGSDPAAPTIPGYEATLELYRGSQSLVMLGRCIDTGARVAIKVLLSSAWVSDGARRRFEREIELISSLDHPNIVRVLDRGVSVEGHPVLVMEYVAGVPLDDYPTSRVADRRHSLELFVTICAAVSHAHQHGIIHRDLKPSNIRVDEAGQPRILDFGIARLIGADAPASLAVTVSSQFLGTPAFAAPEQFLRQPHEIDTRADIYALGVILYRLITGRLPYRDTGSIGGLIRCITAPASTRALVSLEEAGVAASADLRAIIDKALAREPEDRYQTVNALAEDVRAVLDGRPTTARPPTRKEELMRALARHRAVAALVTAIVVLSLGFAATTTILALRAERARQDAEAAREQAAGESERSKHVLEFLTSLIFQAHVGADDPDHQASRVILNRAHDQLGSDPPADPAVRSVLHDIIGRSYYSIQETARGVEHLTAALETGGLDDHPARRMQVRLLLGIALLEQGEPARAAEAARQFLAEASDPECEMDPIAVAMAYRLSRMFHRGHGDAELAEAVLRAAWNSAAGSSAARRTHVAVGTDLAELLLARRAPIESIMPIIEGTIAMSNELDGSDEFLSLRARAVRARAFEAQGRIDAALAEAGDVVTQCVESLGESSPQTLAAMADLGRLQMKSGDPAAAEQTLSRCFSLCTETLGAEDVLTLQVADLMAEASRTRSQ